MDIYEPAEDSYLLQEVVRDEVHGRVLDVGTGSGIQALTAAKSSRVREVVAVDLNPDAVKELSGKNRKVSVFQSDLFEKVTGKFNFIIFNPPYLPQDKGIVDAALYGGKKGWEISARFFSDVSKYLIGDGKIFFLFSTLTNKEKIEELISYNLLEFKEVASQKISFETLYVYEITKSKLLRELESKLVEGVSYFTEGNRGIIYTGTLDKGKMVKSHISKSSKVNVAIKVEKRDMGRVDNEINWLKILNKERIGPKMLFSGKDYFVYEFVEGEFILDYVENHSKSEIEKVLKEVLFQCRRMDQLGMTKEEMHHPQKHVLIDKRAKVVLLDFERCTRTDKPQNVTQFIEFICRLKKPLNFNVDLLRELAANYKTSYSKDDFNTIVNSLEI